ncbi:hypothetical protein Leryth_015754 [Lithospermum erythrorhizon]|nr:hypothetical protein Leryth_015754 [Lithospermum erythrorhizon]
MSESTKQESALKYIDLSLKSGYMLSMDAFTDCVRSCVNQGRLDLLLSIIERCKKMDEECFNGTENPCGLLCPGINGQSDRLKGRWHISVGENGKADPIYKLLLH